MSGMAEVLAAHADWTYLIASNTMACTGRHCVWTYAPLEGETARDAYRNHQAAALSAAGFGDVREQQARIDAVKNLADEWASLADGDRYYAKHIRAAISVSINTTEEGSA